MPKKYMVKKTQEAQRRYRSSNEQAINGGFKY